MKRMKNCPILPDEPSFEEVFLEAEFPNQEKYQKTLSILTSHLHLMYKKNQNHAELNEYVLLEKGSRKGIAPKHVTLELATASIFLPSLARRPKRLTFEDYVEKTAFLVVHERLGVRSSSQHPMTLQGFFEAMQQYNSLESDLQTAE